MGSIFSELFNNWVNAFEQEEGKKKPIHLPNAKENYRETAKYQMIPSATKDFMSSFGQTQSFFTYFSFSPCVMPSRSSTIRPRSFQTSFLAPPIFSPKSLIIVISCMMLLEAKTTYFLSFFVSWFNTFRYCDF